MSADVDVLVKELGAEAAIFNDREKLLNSWGVWRKAIADGCTASWPRDAFESLIDEAGPLIQRAAAALTAMSARVADLERDNADLIKQATSLQAKVPARNEPYRTHVREG